MEAHSNNRSEHDTHFSSKINKPIQCTVWSHDNSYQNFNFFYYFFGKILLIILKKAKKNQKNEKYNVEC